MARRLDAVLLAAAQEKGLTVASPASDLQVARRLALALQGRILSLEEIRWFEQQPAETRLRQLTDRLMSDLRHSDHLAESLSVSFVNEVSGDLPFSYRRTDFVRWLSSQFAEGRPYDETVRAMIAGRGLWTSEPAVNFLTARNCKPSDLTAQSSRLFLGLRLECAECHDHPFADWKRADFHGLAAFYGQLVVNYAGIQDTPREYFMEDRETQQQTPVSVGVPFDTELDPGHGPPRERLANWLTHPQNSYFGRAAANRFWMIVFGRSPIEPVDDLEQEERTPGALALLAGDFTRSHFNVQRLLRVLVSTQAFRRASAFQQPAEASQEEIFAAFPLTRLRPLELASSQSQTRWPTPLDRSANVLLRTMFTLDDWSYWWDYGHPSPDDVLAKPAAIQDQLPLLNGERLIERAKIPLLSTPEFLSLLGNSDDDCVEALYLVALCRRPEPDERAHFVALLHDCTGDQRVEVLQDALWSLVNSVEFAWNH